jgi:hypothetical protein
MPTATWNIPRSMIGVPAHAMLAKQQQDPWLQVTLVTAVASIGIFLFDLLGASGVTGFSLYGAIVAIMDPVVVV